MIQKGDIDMKKLFLIIAITLLGLLLGACSSATYFGVKSVDNEVSSYKGKEVVTKEDSSLTVSLEFDGQSEGSLMFYVYVKNNSNSSVRIDPKEIFFEVTDKEFYPLDIKPSYAIDPEREISHINKEMKSRESWHNVAQGLNVVFGLASIISDASSNHRNRNKGHEIAKDIAVTVSNAVGEKINYDMDINEMEKRKEFWKNEVLRITDLYHGESIGGLVFLPINPKAKYLRVIFPIENKDYEFLYKQYKLK